MALEWPYRVDIKTSGDLDGRWIAILLPRDAGVHVDLLWEVTVSRPILKLLAPLLRPAFDWNHRWTTVRGEQGLRDYLAASNLRSTETLIEANVGRSLSSKPP